MVLRNQQADAPNFVKFFHQKSPLLRGTSSYKRGLHPIISPGSRKRGVQITSNASQTALTSMLETVKIGVWETPERLDAMRFSPHGLSTCLFTWSCWADSNRRPHPYQWDGDFIKAYYSTIKPAFWGCFLLLFVPFCSLSVRPVLQRQ